MTSLIDPASASLKRARRLYDTGRLQAALEQCRLARAANPASSPAWGLTGAICLRLQNPQQAADALDIAIRLDPMEATAYVNLGAALRALDRLPEAKARLETGLALEPALPGLWFNLGLVLDDLGLWRDAADAYRCALALDRTHVAACARLTDALRQLGRADEAERCARAGLALAPDAAPLHGCLAQALLEQGKLAEGWAELEWRRAVPRLSGAPRHADRPLWRGERLHGQVLLLHAEQGYGDTLQFCRYAALIEGAGRILLEVPAPLVGLLASLHPRVEPVPDGASLPAFDLQCPLLSLPGCCGTDTVADIPAPVAYLRADLARVARWSARLAGLPGRRIGLCWAGGRRPDPETWRVDDRRSMALARLAPLGGLDDVTFVSLQKGAPAADQARSPPPGLALVDWAGELDDFAETAALVTGLDLVVTVDTAIAHLAGALGRPVWMLNRFDTDWRWLQGRDDSPWYPTLRQFRQRRPGDWDEVIARLADALAGRVASVL